MDRGILWRSESWPPTKEETSGMFTEITRLSSGSVIAPGPMMKDSIGTSFSCFNDLTVTVAFAQYNNGVESAAGDALQTFPTIVAILRICTLPTVLAASANDGNFSFIFGSRITES